MLKNNFQSINVANARATVPSDEEVIKTLINESLGGLQQLNFKLFGFPHLVGRIKLNPFFPLVIGEVRF